MNRRGFLCFLGTAVVVGLSHGLLGKNSLKVNELRESPRYEPVDPKVKCVATYANASNMIAALKELYVDDAGYMKDPVYANNPFLKDESPDGFTGKYLPVPLKYEKP